MALTYDQIEEGKVYIRNGKEIRIVNKHVPENYLEGGIIEYQQYIIYCYLDNSITRFTCPFEMAEIFAVPEVQAPPPLLGLGPKMDVYNKHSPTIICSENGKIIEVVIPDDACTPHIPSVDIGDGKIVDIPTYNRIITDNFYKTPTKETSLKFLEISEIWGLEGSMEEQISKILRHFPDGIVII